MNNPDYRCYDCNAEWSSWILMRFCPACGSPVLIKLYDEKPLIKAGEKV